MPPGRHPPDADDLFVTSGIRAFARDADLAPPPTGQEWVGRAAEAGVLSPLVSALRRNGWAAPGALGRLRGDVVARHLRTLRDVSDTGRVLDAAGVAWAALKGPVLSVVVFGSPLVRDYTDLDLLVRPRDVRRAVQVLVEAGAEVMPVDWTHVNRARTAELGLLLEHGTVLDLHWNLVNLGRTRRAYRLPTDVLLDRRVVRDLDGVDVATLDDLDFVLHVLLHACLSGCSSLRWLLDAQQSVRWLAPRHTPQQLAARAAELGLTAPARAVLDSVVTHLDQDVGPWAAAMGTPTPWTRLLSTLSLRRPPSTPSVSAHSNKTWYAATRPTTSSSLGAIARTGVLSARYSRSGWPEPAPTAYTAGDPGYDEWLRIAERGRW